MNFWRNNQILRDGLCCLFALLLCSQSFSNGNNLGPVNQESVKNCVQAQNAVCIDTDLPFQSHSESKNEAPAQHSQDKDLDLEEKGEKEVEDDKEEMNSSSNTEVFSLNCTVTATNHLAVTSCTGPTREVPTPPSNC